MPTGGVSLDNLADYLTLPNVAAVGGSWITPAGDIAAGRWSHITELALGAVAAAGRLRKEPA
jgi:2-dehydro-3-deoxyphosphogluconate aldolase/(4S)-4-hydroxy-2-oxoglutarate aldolase